MQRVISTAVALALATPVFAQDDAISIGVAQSEKFGHYLTDAEGRPVYSFTADTRASPDQQAEISCSDEDCLEAWPLVATSGDPEAGEGSDAALLGSTNHGNQQIVTYNGWPLYHFASDAPGEEPQGYGLESFGGEWRLVAPSAQAMATDLPVGATIYADACAQCHGPAGQGMASFPSVAGKNAHFIASRLGQYRAGETIGSNSALMMPVASALSDEDIANLAAFVSADFQ